MARRRYSPQELAFLEAGYRKMRIPELTAAFNQRFGLEKSEQQVRATLRNHRFRCGRPPGTTKGMLRIFTLEQMGFIQGNYEDLGRKAVTKALNDGFGTAFTLNQVTAFIKNHKLYSARTGHFPPGHVPFNKGTKGLMKPNSGSFQKGNMSGTAQLNYVSIGTERISKDGYRERKVTDDPTLAPARRWQFVHRILWEEAHGPIPAGHVIVFLDGDRSNTGLDNLRCVHRGVLQYMNKTGLNRTTGEARKAAILTAEVQTRALQLEAST